ncbi:MAG: winged helix-turn-helix transcriptional regulator [Candidatus Pacearchaeota archaeon]
MRPMFLILFLSLLFLILFSPLVKSATIYGNIYDFKLEKIVAFVMINSTPLQKQLTNGSYSFEVPLGVYVIEAYYKDEEGFYYDREIIEIKNEGNYKIDLILMEVDDIFFNDTEINEILDLMIAKKKEQFNFKFLILILVIILLIILSFFFIFKHYRKKIKEKKEKEKKMIFISPDKFKEEVIKILEKERRILQKDLRKRLNVSEAKLSLLITELEEEGKVKKIKRGRGNIIIWQE